MTDITVARAETLASHAAITAARRALADVGVSPDQIEYRQGLIDGVQCVVLSGLGYAVGAEIDADEVAQ